MLQNPCKTFGFKKNMVYKIPPGGGGKPYPASGLIDVVLTTNVRSKRAGKYATLNRNLCTWHEMQSVLD